jgi:hypothetical protein
MKFNGKVNGAKQVNSNLHRAGEQMRGATYNATRYICLYGVRYIKSHYTPGGGKRGRHSLPGQAPAVQTGTLRASISTETILYGSKIIGRVFTPKVYGAILEIEMNRPSFIPALIAMNAIIGRIYAAYLAQAIGGTIKGEPL